MNTKKSTKKKVDSKKKTKSGKKNESNCFPAEWFNEMPAPIFILDEDGEMLYGNNAFCDLIKRKKNECMKVKPMDMMLEESENRTFLKDLLSVYSGKTIKRKVYRLTIAKRSFNALMDISPVYDKQQKIVKYAIGLILDHDAKSGLTRLRNLFQ